MQMRPSSIAFLCSDVRPSGEKTGWLEVAQELGAEVICLVVGVCLL